MAPRDRDLEGPPHDLQAAHIGEVELVIVGCIACRYVVARTPVARTAVARDAIAGHACSSSGNRAAHRVNGPGTPRCRRRVRPPVRSRRAR